MRKKDLETAINQMYNKYNRLLWYARSKPEDISIPNVLESLKKIEKLYPQEVSELKSERSDWQHGFHSGCCAAFAYVLTCMDNNQGIEVAEEEFPFLDS